MSLGAKKHKKNKGKPVRSCCSKVKSVELENKELNFELNIVNEKIVIYEKALNSIKDGNEVPKNIAFVALMEGSNLDKRGMT